MAGHSRRGLCSGAAQRGNRHDTELEEDKWQLIRTEALKVATIMRTRGRTVGDITPATTGSACLNEHELLSGFDDLRRHPRAPRESAVMLLVRPFVNVITSPKTSSAETSAALMSCDGFLANRVVTAACDLEELLEGVLQCHFDQTGASADEVVISNMFQVLVSVCASEQSASLPVALLAEALQTLLRVHMDMRVSPLLRQSTEAAVVRMCESILLLCRTRVGGDGLVRQTAELGGGGGVLVPKAAQAAVVSGWLSHSHAVPTKGCCTLPSVVTWWPLITARSRVACTERGWQNGGTSLPEGGCKGADTRRALLALLCDWLDPTVRGEGGSGIRHLSDSMQAALLSVVQKALVLGTNAGAKGGELESWPGGKRTLVLTVIRAHVNLARAPETSPHVLALVLSNLRCLISRLMLRFREAIEVVLTQVYIAMLSNGGGADPRCTTAGDRGIRLVDPAALPLTLAEGVREVVLEGLLDLCALEGFLFQVYVGYDCRVAAPNLLQQIMATLAFYITPSAACTRSTQKIALHALLSGLTGLVQRLQGGGDSGVCEKVLLEQRKKKTHYIHAVAHFNRSPKLALRLLTTEGLLPPLDLSSLEDGVEAGRGLQAVADGFAEFLKFGSRNGMTKQALGEYLGERDDLSEAVLHTYARLFDFQGVGLVSALREFLESFKLPGESQKIERITEAFAQAYFAQQTGGVFLTWDSVHILTFSVIMLNTDLHSPQVKKRMTLDEFVRNTRGTNVDNNRNLREDFPRTMLEEIYSSIALHEIRLDPQRELGGGRGSGRAVMGVERRLQLAWAASAVGWARSSPVPPIEHAHKLAGQPFAGFILSNVWGPAITSVVGLLRGGVGGVGGACGEEIAAAVTACVDVLAQIAANSGMPHFFESLAAALARRCPSLAPSAEHTCIQSAASAIAMSNSMHVRAAFSSLVRIVLAHGMYLRNAVLWQAIWECVLVFVVPSEDPLVSLEFARRQDAGAERVPWVVTQILHAQDEFGEFVEASCVGGSVAPSGASGTVSALLSGSKVLSPPRGAPVPSMTTPVATPPSGAKAAAAALRDARSSFGSFDFSRVSRERERERMSGMEGCQDVSGRHSKEIEGEFPDLARQECAEFLRTTCVCNMLASLGDLPHDSKLAALEGLLRVVRAACSGPAHKAQETLPDMLNVGRGLLGTCEALALHMMRASGGEWHECGGVWFGFSTWKVMFDYLSPILLGPELAAGAEVAAAAASTLLNLSVVGLRAGKAGCMRLAAGTHKLLSAIARMPSVAFVELSRVLPALVMALVEAGQVCDDDGSSAPQRDPLVVAILGYGKGAAGESCGFFDVLRRLGGGKEVVDIISRLVRDTRAGIHVEIACSCVELACNFACAAMRSSTGEHATPTCHDWIELMHAVHVRASTTLLAWGSLPWYVGRGGGGEVGAETAVEVAVVLSLCRVALTPDEDRGLGVGAGVDLVLLTLEKVMLSAYMAALSGDDWLACFGGGEAAGGLAAVVRAFGHEVAGGRGGDGKSLFRVWVVWSAVLVRHSQVLVLLPSFEAIWSLFTTHTRGILDTFSSSGSRTGAFGVPGGAEGEETGGEEPKGLVRAGGGNVAALLVPHHWKAMLDKLSEEVPQRETLWACTRAEAEEAGDVLCQRGTARVHPEHTAATNGKAALVPCMTGAEPGRGEADALRPMPCATSREEAVSAFSVAGSSPTSTSPSSLATPWPTPAPEPQSLPCGSSASSTSSSTSCRRACIHHLSADDMHRLTEHEMRELGVPVGARKRFLKLRESQRARDSPGPQSL